MNTAMNDMHPTDDEKRRARVDRRQYSYTHYIPERRSGRDRREDISDDGLRQPDKEKS